MIEVLLTTLETEMSTTAVDQDLAKKIANIISKVHRILNLPENLLNIWKITRCFVRSLWLARDVNGQTISCY